MGTTILGLGGFDHDGAAALLRDGQLVGHLEWERVSRRRYAGLQTPDDVDRLLAATGWNLDDIDVIAWSDRERFAMPEPRPIREHLRRRFPRAELVPVDHHRSHLASAWYVAGFSEAAVLSIDGKGDDASAAIALGRRDDLIEIRRQPSASSVGRTWHALAIICGSPHFGAAGKVMALAGHGEPRFLGELLAWTELHDDGTFSFTAPGEQKGSGPTFRRAQLQAAFLHDRLSLPHVPRGALPGPAHADLAASVQAWTQVIVEHLARAAVAAAGCRSLCMAGGVALNVLANSHLLSAGIVDRLFVQPAAGDSGLALGAALALHARALAPRSAQARFCPYLGRAFSDEVAAAELARVEGVAWRSCDEVAKAAASAILRGERIGWFQDREEAGPRALGARSLLASPASPGERDRINRWKGREPYRPLALAVTDALYRERFDGPACPYMLLSATVRDGAAHGLGEGLHVDGSSRLQLVDEQSAARFRDLLEAVARAGSPPALINTSLNANGEPIVGTPAEAARLLVRGVIDRLFIGNLEVTPLGSPR